MITPPQGRRLGWSEVRPYLITVATLAAFVAVLRLFGDWAFAAGLTGIVLIHEVGHMIGGALRGIPTRPPVFIPFLGAFVSWKEKPKSALDEAVLTAGGPVLGLAATAAVWAISLLYPEPALLKVARMGFALHVINLVPILPFDGGRLTRAVARWIHSVVTPAVFFLAIWSGATLTAGLYWSLSRNALREESDDYGPLAWRPRLLLAIGYMGLVTVSLLGYLGVGGKLANLLYLGLGDHELEDPYWAAGLTVVLLGLGAAWRAFSRWGDRVQQQDKELIRRARELEFQGSEEER